MATPERWMGADRAEQEASGQRYGGVKPPRGRYRPNLDNIMKILEANRARTAGSNAGYTPNEDGSNRPYALTHEQWLAAQNGGASADPQAAGFMADWASEGDPQAIDPQQRTGTVLTPNIDSSDPFYTDRLKSAESQRLARRSYGVGGRTTSETFTRMIKAGPNGEYVNVGAVDEGYSYFTLAEADAQAEYDSLPDKIKAQFRRTADTMGRYEGEIGPVGLYRSLMRESGKLQYEEGVLMAPEELLFWKIQKGELSPGQRGGGGDGSDSSGGGGGYGGGGGGGTVQLTTSQQARYYVTQAYRSLLGRRPTEDEVDEFIRVLRQAELGNPQSMQIIDGVAATTGGFDPSILAEQMAQSEEDYQTRGNYNYFNMFIDSLAGA